MLDLEFVHFLPFSKGCFFNIGTDKKHDNSIMTATNCHNSCTNSYNSGWSCSVPNSAWEAVSRRHQTKTCHFQSPVTTPISFMKL